ncbi:hypothetical protein O181_025546 [Austropuccinia psidii MF-1]|uniref:Uncharacterized protein n=1 Tax=Austropuccinia psidii MF-1 TaxID=1389203 RepID=A0A9Q3GZN2_9BASI|nr:hypothetical protein [Austropuccinia psidii MF-1]
MNASCGENASMLACEKLPSSNSSKSIGELKKSVTTTKNDPPPWVLRQFQPGTKWPHHIIVANLAPSGALWHFWPHHYSLAFYGLRPYPAIIGLGQF